MTASRRTSTARWPTSSTPTPATLVVDVLADTGHAGFAVDRVRAAIAADAKLGGRLALWGRRLLGEALAQAQRVAAERDTLAPLFTGGPERPGADLAELVADLQPAHRGAHAPDGGARPVGLSRR